MRNWIRKGLKEPNGSWVMIWPMTFPAYALFFWSGVQKRPGLRLTILLLSAAIWVLAYYAVTGIATECAEGNWLTVVFLGIRWFVAHIIATVFAAIAFCELQDG